MKRCLFTYQELKKSEKYYSFLGLKKLHPKLAQLTVFPYTRQQQIIAAQKAAGKMSIQGVQAKLSVQLSLKDEQFKIVETGGTFIVKPQTDLYPELPENEDLTMHLAALAGLETPWHGLILGAGQSRSYIVKRFDRAAKGKRFSQEDFAQIIGASRNTKYEASMEKVAETTEYCTFPSIEKLELFKRTIFSFLVGNEDMHLKNFSLITDGKNKIKLTPAYDLVNSTIAMDNATEELALSLRDKKKGFKKKDFISYATEDLFIPERKAEKEIKQIISGISKWNEMIAVSFLSDQMKKKYHQLVASRAQRIMG